MSASNSHNINGYKEFLEFMEKFKKEDTVYVLFSGSKLPNGKSWCDDCLKSWPIIEKVMKKYGVLDKPKSHFVHVEVGDRSTWKNMENPFRKDTKCKLLVIPTLMKWGHPQKLEGEKCEKEELVELVFSDDA